jgi:hypothetical protein
MPDRHKNPPLRFRPPEPERSWLAAYQERTGKPMNAILTEAVRLLMVKETKPGLVSNPLREHSQPGI